MGRLVLLVALFGCGRLGFDARTSTGDPDATVAGDGGDANAIGDGNGNGPFVQSNFTNEFGSMISIATTLTAPITQGNTLVVVVGWNDETSSIASIVDDRGNTYTSATPYFRGQSLSETIYYASNAAAGSTTITATFDTLALNRGIQVLEYRGIAASPVDNSISNNGNSTSVSSGMLTTSGTNELLLGALIINNVATSSPDPSWILRSHTTPFSDMVEEAPAPLPGMYQATASISIASGWVIGVLALRLQ